MAKKLVEHYDYTYAIFLSKLLAKHAKFQKDVFLDFMHRSLDKETFLKRQDLYVEAIKRSLDITYPEMILFIKTIWGEELKGELGMFKEGWWLWPLGRYVETYGALDMDVTLDFLEDFTKRQTGEFAIRPLLIKNPKYVMERLLKWSKSDNVHVRRLSSEAMRISLPWAPKTTKALEHFELYEKVLTNLSEDQSKFVQKSVANNLNDLYKYDSNKADEIILKWNQTNKHTQWIIKHARRNQK